MLTFHHPWVRCLGREVLALHAERTQRTIRFFGAEGICGLPARGWQSYIRTSLAMETAQTPQLLAKAGDMSLHSLFCHSQILASLPSTCLRIERIKYSQGNPKQAHGGKGNAETEGKCCLKTTWLLWKREHKRQKNCFASNAARTHPQHSQLLPGWVFFFTSGNSAESFRTLLCCCLREPVTFPWGGFKAPPAQAKVSR